MYYFLEKVIGIDNLEKISSPDMKKIYRKWIDRHSLKSYENYMDDILIFVYHRNIYYLDVQMSDGRGKSHYWVLPYQAHREYFIREEYESVIESKFIKEDFLNLTLAQCVKLVKDKSGLNNKFVQKRLTESVLYNKFNLIIVNGKMVDKDAYKNDNHLLEIYDKFSNVIKIDDVVGYTRNDLMNLLELHNIKVDINKLEQAIESENGVRIYNSKFVRKDSKSFLKQSPSNKTYYRTYQFKDSIMTEQFLEQKIRMIV